MRAFIPLQILVAAILVAGAPQDEGTQNVPVAPGPGTTSFAGDDGVGGVEFVPRPLRRPSQPAQRTQLHPAQGPGTDPSRDPSAGPAGDPADEAEAAGGPRRRRTDRDAGAPESGQLVIAEGAQPHAPVIIALDLVEPDVSKSSTTVHDGNGSVDLGGILDATVVLLTARADGNGVVALARSGVQIPERSADGRWLRIRIIARDAGGRLAAAWTRLHPPADR